MSTRYRTLVNDADALSKLHAAARRERAREVHRLLVAPLLRLVRQPTLRSARMLPGRASS